MDREQVKDARTRNSPSIKRQQGDGRQPATLPSALPERPITYQRNFVKENVKRIKQFRKTESNGLRTNSDLNQKQADPNFPTSTSLSKIKQADQDTFKHATMPMQRQQQQRRPGIQKLEIRPADRRIPGNISDLILVNNLCHRSMQTEASDIIEQIYSTGVIKYPKGIQPISPRKRGIRKDPGNGDSPEVTNIMPPVKEVKEETRTDFIRNNVLALRTQAGNKKANHAMVTSPPKIRRSRMPKLPKPRKDTTDENVVDEDCPPGHVLLPDEERKETLRVLRESYAEKIQEMNSMPVRSDTLKMQKRKMDLELELKKIDEGVKVFQRPKVYVKVDG